MFKVNPSIFYNAAIIESDWEEINSLPTCKVFDWSVFKAHCVLRAISKAGPYNYQMHFHRAVFSYYFKPSHVAPTETWFSNYDERIIACLLAREIAKDLAYDNP